ncbi:MAG: MFS transporter [Rhodocyclaceae bacterium]|nr:MAG: MFS transporter [Rhodocyclaceae bacterium]
MSYRTAAQRGGEGGVLPKKANHYRQATFRQALVLLLASCMPVLGMVLIAPGLPRIQAYFGGVPHVEVLAPVALTIPSLFIALLSPVAGAITDFFGRKRLLIGCLVLYAVAGTAPLWQQDLIAIIVSRGFVGIAEAGIMTACTTMIGDYFHGGQRERYLSLQTIFATMCATLFLMAGGALGENDWRTPFAVYGVAVALIPAVAFGLWEPDKASDALAEGGQNDHNRVHTRWRFVFFICLVTLLGGIAFFTTQVELGFLLELLGISSPSRVGMAIASGSLMVTVGAVLFRRLVHAGVPTLLTLSFAMAGVGFLQMSWAGSYTEMLVGVVINNLGTGLLLPSLLVWVMRQLPFEHRGRGTGLWTASFYLGQFVCPLVVMGISQHVGGLSGAIGTFGWCALALAVFALTTVRRKTGHKHGRH